MYQEIKGMSQPNHIQFTKYLVLEFLYFFFQTVVSVVSHHLLIMSANTRNIFTQK